MYDMFYLFVVSENLVPYDTVKLFFSFLNVWNNFSLIIAFIVNNCILLNMHFSYYFHIPQNLGMFLKVLQCSILKLVMLLLNCEDFFFLY